MMENSPFPSSVDGMHKSDTKRLRTTSGTKGGVRGLQAPLFCAIFRGPKRKLRELSDRGKTKYDGNLLTEYPVIRWTEEARPVVRQDKFKIFREFNSELGLNHQKIEQIELASMPTA